MAFACMFNVRNLKSDGRHHHLLRFPNVGGVTLNHLVRKTRSRSWASL